MIPEFDDNGLPAGSFLMGSSMEPPDEPWQIGQPHPPGRPGRVGVRDPAGCRCLGAGTVAANCRYRTGGSSAVSSQ